MVSPLEDANIQWADATKSPKVWREIRAVLSSEALVPWPSNSNHTYTNPEIPRPTMLITLSRRLTLQ